MAHHEDASEPTLLGQNKNSWYRIQDDTGRKRELLACMGGIEHCRAVCDAYRTRGYDGLTVTKVSRTNLSDAVDRLRMSTMLEVPPRLGERQR